MVLVELLGVAVKEFPVVKTRQRVALGGLDDVAVLTELDRAPDAGQDHTPLWIGLGNKVDRAKTQTLDLRVLIGRQHDNRDA